MIQTFPGSSFYFHPTIRYFVCLGIEHCTPTHPVELATTTFTISLGNINITLSPSCIVVTRRSRRMWLGGGGGGGTLGGRGGREVEGVGVGTAATCVEVDGLVVSTARTSEERASEVSMSMKVPSYVKYELKWSG